MTAERVQRKQAKRRCDWAVILLSILFSTIVSLVTFRPAQYIFQTQQADASANSTSTKEASTILRGSQQQTSRVTSLASENPHEPIENLTGTPSQSNSHPAYSVTIQRIAEGATDVCVPWNMNMDSWWAENPYWEVYRTNDSKVCFRQMEDTAKAHFFRKLHDLQNGACSHVVTSDVTSSMWGVYFKRVVHSLAYGLQQGVPVQIANSTQQGWRYATKTDGDGSTRVCPSGDMFCYFLPISQCASGKSSMGHQKLDPVSDETRQWLLEYVTRPQQWLRRRVYERLQSNDQTEISTPCAVLHMHRRNDEEDSLELTDYVSSLHREVLGGRSNILLVSDDESLYTKAKGQFPEYHWISLKKVDSKIWDPIEEVVSQLVTFQLARQCDVLVEESTSSAVSIHDQMVLSGTSITRVQATRETSSETDNRAQEPQPALLSTNTTEEDKYCVPWDTNVDAWWTNHPEWVHDTDSEEATCFQRERSPRADFFRQIYNNQFVSGDCSVVHTKHMWSSGFNADMHNIMDGLTYGLEEKRPFQITFEPTHSTVWHYAALKDGSNPVCPTKDMFCFFLPLGKCKPGKIDPEAFRSKTLELNGLERRRWLNDFVARPQQWLRRRVYEYMRDKAPSLPPGTICMHVRRSDVVLHGDWSRKYFAIEDYLMGLRKENIEVKNILLLTDDANAIDEALEFHPEYNWLYLHRRRHRGAEGGWENQLPSKDPILEMVTLLATFNLVKQCDVIVHGTSGFADTLVFHMEATGRAIKALNVEEDLGYDKLFSKKHEESVATLEKRLEKRRNRKVTATKKDQAGGKAVDVGNVQAGMERSDKLSQESKAYRPPPGTDKFCVPWEENMDPWWSQSPEWHVESENEEELCFAKEDSPRTAFLRDIHNLQFVEGNCSQTKTRHMWSSGFGADTSNVVDGLMYALETKTPFQIDLVPEDKETGWHYAAMKDGSKPVCKTRDMFCYFLPVGRCAPTEIDRDANSLSRTMSDDKRRWLFDYSIRNQQWLRRRVFEYMRDRAPKLPEQTICMHVRRSDVVLHGDHSRKYFAIEDYLTALHTGKVFNKDILLLTDDANAIDEALEFHPEYNWHFLNRTRHRGAEGGWENQIPSKDPADELVTILATFRLAKKCNVLVHGKSSFSDLLHDSMISTGRQITRLRVESGDELLHPNNTASAELLQQHLDQKRKQNIRGGTGNAR